MTTNENVYGGNIQSFAFLVAPNAVGQIKVHNPDVPEAMSMFHVLDEDNVIIDKHSIDTFCEVNTNRKTIPTKDNEYFFFGLPISDLQNHLTAAKALLQAYGYVLGGEDFANPDPKAFWIFTMQEELNEWLAATPHNQT